MSKRPTNKSRKEYANAHNSDNSYNYAIIGDTISATLYAKRLIGNNVTTNISIISEGIDRTNNNKISDMNFAAINNKRILRHLITEKIHMIPAGDNQCEDDDLVNTQIDQILHYHVGSGPLGDFISAYHIPRLGPWFNSSVNTRLEKFLRGSTAKTNLNDQELLVMNLLKDTWNLQVTNSLIVEQPSILNCHYEFINDYHNKESRMLFLNEYHTLNQKDNIDYISEATNIKFTHNSETNLDNIEGSNVSLQDVRLIWKTNPYTYLRLASEGGLSPSYMDIPVFYRAVLSIPQTNTGGVDLSDTNLLNEDLLTTHLGFSLHDLNNPKSSGLTWLVQCYTTAEDLSIIDLSGKYADTNKSLLIIEAICTKNRRKTSYNIAEHEIQVEYNDRIIESGYLNQFSQIASTIYKAHTNTDITIDPEISVCGAEGTCQDSANILDYSARESPLVSILQLASKMYGLDVYLANY